MSGAKLLIGIGRIAVILFGCLGLVVQFSVVVRTTYLFVDPRFEGFWEDVRAHQFEEEGSKSADELLRLYGARAMVTYVLDPGLTAAYVPSEEAALTNMAAGLFLKWRARHRQRTTA